MESEPVRVRHFSFYIAVSPLNQQQGKNEKPRCDKRSRAFSDPVGNCKLLCYARNLYNRTERDNYGAAGYATLPISFFTLLMVRGEQSTTF